MSEMLRVGDFSLDFDALYARMWDLSVDDRGDGSRLFRPRPGQNEALKWLISELAGTPVDVRQTMPENNALRRAVHQRLADGGLADRLSQSSFRLLKPPRFDQAERPDAREVEPAAIDAEDLGQTVEDVSVDDVVDDAGLLQLGGHTWSPWVSLQDAAAHATTSPGVYVARVDDQVVYVGMAGERRGQGVRGRLRVYARGRGAVSGLGEAALDRALADPEWVQDRLNQLRDRGPTRAKDWAAAAMNHSPLELTWTDAPTADEARVWEREILTELEDSELWNRQRP